jgi:hypothetical protein
MSKFKIKTIFICFFDIRCITHFEFAAEETIVIQTFHVQVLESLTDALWRKRGVLWRDRSLILRHNNAPVHSSFRVSQFLAGEAYPP